MIWLGLPAPGLVSYGEDGLSSRDRDLWLMLIKQSVSQVYM